MKKQKNSSFAGILTIALLAVAIAAVFLVIEMQKDKAPSSSQSSIAESSDSSAESSKTESSKAESSKTGSSKVASQTTSQSEIKARIAVIDEALNSDFLRLVSVKSPLEKNFVPELASVASDSSKQVDKRIKPYLDSFLKEAKAQGNPPPTTLSCYRSYATQVSLYNNKITQLQNQGMTKEEATKEAGTIVAIPGTSEHQYGMSADIAIKSGSQLVPETIEIMSDNIWYRAHAAEYGFILRFPKGKETITGIMYEPWHFRYVGKEHAKIITEKGLCLEEYLDSLKAEKQSLEKKLK